MSTVLKITVILLLVLAIGALVTQLCVLYPARTEIKERTLKLENGVAKVVSTLKNSLPEEQQGSVSFNKNALKPGKNAAKDARLNGLDKELIKANAAAETVIGEWENTKGELEQSKQELSETKDELASTQSELESAKQDVERLQETVTAKNQEIAEKDQQIAAIEDEKAELEGTISTLEQQVSEQEQTIAEQEAEKDTLTQQLERCEGDLNRNTGTVVMKEGVEGKVVYANAEWNFIIIDVGNQDSAAVGAEMIIHRDDEMIGKLRIKDVKDHFSVCETLPEYETSPVKEGDHVLY